MNKCINVSDKVTTKAKIAGRKSSETQINNSSFYNLYNINSGLIGKRIPYIKIREISQSLIKTDKENYLGKTKRAKITLNRYNKLHQIGLYVVKL